MDVGYKIMRIFRVGNSKLFFIEESSSETNSVSVTEEEREKILRIILKLISMEERIDVTVNDLADIKVFDVEV
jgi:hypothetical protein